MSQVKKLLIGGTPKVELAGAPELKFEPVPELNFQKTQNLGTLTIDGKAYYATPELIQSLSKYLHAYGEMAAPLAGLTAALQNGEHIIYDSVGNTITGMSGKWTGIDERTNKRRNSGASQWRLNRDAWLNNDAHKFRKAVSLLSGFGAFAPNADKTSSDSKDLLDIYGDKLWFDYTNNDDGTKTYLKNSSKNLSINQRLDRITNYLMSDDEGKKGYRLNEWYNPQRIDALKKLYEDNAQGWNKAISKIRRKAEAGEDLTADELAFLENFNIIKPDDPEAAAKAELDDAKKQFNASGLDYDKWSPYISWNKDKGYWVVTPEGQEAFISAFGGNGNYWFNDTFTKSKYNRNGQFDFLNGYFVLGDRLYKQSDASNATSDLSKILNKSGGFRDLNAGMRHREANDLIEQLWGSDIGWNAPDATYYSNWMDPNGNIYYRSRTGDYDWTGKNGNQQLVEYVEANPELADEFGYYTPKFRLTDAYGNVDLNQQGPTIIEGLAERPLANRQPSRFNRRRLWFSENGNSEFDGRYLIGDAIDSDGNVSGAGFWIDPNDPTKPWIFESSEMSRYVSGLEGNAVIIPKKMSDMLQSNPDFMRNFQNNPEFRRKFVKLISGSVGSAWNPSTSGSNVSARLWRSLGFTPQQAEALRKIGRLMQTGSRGKRRTERMITKPTLHKDGGKVKKAGMGDMLGSAGSTDAAPTQIKTDKPLRDASAFANFGKDKMQEHDLMELGAVLGDAASIGLAFTPASVASGIAGMAGSTAGFLADVRRDGFQGSDLKQYGLNLILDSASFIPVIGGASKAIKVANNLRRLAPTVNKIMKAAALYGISNAGVQSWEAIKSGNFNMRDLRVLVNALGGATHMARAGFKKPKLNKGETTYPTIKPKAGKEVNELQLTESQFEALSQAKTKDEFASAIAKELNKSKAADAPQITKEEVMDSYDLDEFIKTGRKYLLFGKKRSKIKGFESKKGKTTLGSDYITKDQAKRQYHDDYLATLGGYRREKLANRKVKETVTEMVPQGKWEPEYKTVTEIQGTPQAEGVWIAGENGVYIPSNKVPAVVKQRRVVVNEADKALPVPLKQVERTVERVVPGGYRRIPRITPVTSGVIWERTPDEITSPNEVIPVVQENTSGPRYIWHANNQPNFRKKGGVIKAQDATPGGLGASEESKPATNADEKKYLLKSSKEAMEWMENWKKRDAELEEEIKKLQENPQSQSQWFGKAIRKNWTVPQNWINAGLQHDISKKMEDVGESVPAYQMIGPLHNAPRYTNIGPGNSYRQAGLNSLLLKTSVSDPTLMAMLQKDANATKLKYDIQGGLSDSQEYGKHIAGLDKFNYDVANTNSDLFNHNRYYLYTKAKEDATQKLGHLTRKSQILDKATYSTLQAYNKDINRNATIDATTKYKLEHNKIMNWHHAELAKLDKNSPTYSQDLSLLNTSAANQLEAAKREYDMNREVPGIFAKSGGKLGKSSTVTYSRDPYPELLIQNAKHSGRVIEKLNDSVIKLILQTKPIHVS